MYHIHTNTHTHTHNHTHTKQKPNNDEVYVVMSCFKIHIKKSIM